MVSFTCDVCQDVVKKAKVDAHCAARCRQAWIFTCVDCSESFAGFDYRNHNACMSEEQKYWGPFSGTNKQKSVKDISESATNVIPKNAEYAASVSETEAPEADLPNLATQHLLRELDTEWESVVKKCLRKYGTNKILHWKRLTSLAVDYVLKKKRIPKESLSLKQRRRLGDCCLTKVTFIFRKQRRFCSAVTALNCKYVAYRRFPGNSLVPKIHLFATDRFRCQSVTVFRNEKSH